MVLPLWLRSPAKLAEAVEILKGAFADGPFSFAGEHYRITELDGRQVVRFSSIDKFDPPVDDIDFKQPVAQLIGDTYFDYATGQYVLGEWRYVFPDGSVRLAGRHMVEIRTGQTPPAEITAMIEEKKKGEGKEP